MVLYLHPTLFKTRGHPTDPGFFMLGIFKFKGSEAVKHSNMLVLKISGPVSPVLHRFCIKSARCLVPLA